MNPDDFVITRKRKKYKFAKFFNAENCYEFDEWRQNPPTNDAPVCVELGAGTALFSVELAARHPDKFFVAIDVKADRLQKGAYEALARDLKNVVFVRARADQIDELFLPGSVDELWVTFADPFPRKRSAGRRMTHPTFLGKYAKILTSEGRLNIKHDNAEFFNWTLEQLVAEKWFLTALSFDLHDTPGEQFTDAKILTTYEKRWHQEGRITQFVRANHRA